MKPLRWIVWLMCTLLATVVAQAHEMRPAYLSLREAALDQFQVLWKVPALGDQRLGIYPRLPETCVPLSEPVGLIVDGAYSERWAVSCSGGLRGTGVRIDGLEATLTDALLRVEYASGEVEVVRLTPDQPTTLLAGAQSSRQVALTYFALGMDHILFGFDHLVFVLALVLLIQDRWMLIKTVTAFTVAHSLTLAGVTLGLFSLPQQPVEAAIALSIAFVARELVLMRKGEVRLSATMPWLVAFAFGLLHGFGFAGALQETGLPQTDVPLALLTFNIGVEAGQLLFVGGVLLAMFALRKLLRDHAPAGRGLVAYGIGTVAMVWLLSRLAGFATMA
jgi:hydrogenase/urease accessory protein HupE